MPSSASQMHHVDESINAATPEPTRISCSATGRTGLNRELKNDANALSRRGDPTGPCPYVRCVGRSTSNLHLSGQLMLSKPAGAKRTVSFSRSAISLCMRKFSARPRLILFSFNPRLSAYVRWCWVVDSHSRGILHLSIRRCKYLSESPPGRTQGNIFYAAV
jgi:hypothetical protein